MMIMTRMKRIMRRRQRQVLKSVSFNLEGISDCAGCDGDDKDDYNTS